MNVHIRVGYSETLKCSCGYSPEKNSHLKEHLLRNSGEAFPCSFCDKEFTSPDGVKKHEKQVHGKKHSCRFCDFSAKDKKDITAHVKKAHPQKKKELVRNIRKKIEGKFAY